MKPKQRRGFASMSPEKRHIIAVMGGLAVQASGRGHRFTTEEARKAGSKSKRGKAKQTNQHER